MFNKETTLGEVLEVNEKYAEILMGFGMHCFSCPMSQMETLEEAAEVHGIDVNFLLEKLNNASFKKASTPKRKRK